MAKMDILGSLPREISFKILMNLTPEEIANSLQCCKKWQQLMNYEFFWKRLYEKFYSKGEEEPSSEIYRKHLQSYCLYWQGRYMYNRKIESNVRNGIYKTVRMPLKEEEENLIYFDDHILIFFCLYDKIVIINSSTGSIIRKFFFADSFAAIKHKEFLISVTNKMHLKIWNIENGNCVTDVTISSPLQRCILFKLRACKNLVFIPGVALNTRVPILYVFNRETEEFNYIGESLFVNCTDETIVMAHCNGSISLLDAKLDCLMKFDCLKFTKLHKLLINNNFIVKESESGKCDIIVSVWNINTKSNFKIITNGNLSQVKIIPRDRLVCQTGVKQFEIWDMLKENCLVKVDTKICCARMIVSDHYILIQQYDLPIQIYSITGEEEPSTEIYRKHLQSYCLHWQGRYMYNRKIESNIRNGIYKTVDVPLKEEEQNLIYFDDHILIFYWLLCKIVIINSSTRSIIREFLTPKVSAAIKHKEFLISVTHKMHLKIWKIENGNCVTMLP